MTTRSAAATDITSLVTLMGELYVHEGIPFDAPIAAAALGPLIEDPRLGEVHLILEDGETAGYFVLTFGYSLELHGRYALLDEMYISDEHRGQGLGRKALEFVEEVCRKHGVAALRLEVEHSNLHAQALYRSSGFESHDRHLMTKWL